MTWKHVLMVAAGLAAVIFSGWCGHSEDKQGASAGMMVIAGALGHAGAQSKSSTSTGEDQK